MKTHLPPQKSTLFRVPGFIFTLLCVHGRSFHSQWGSSLQGRPSPEWSPPQLLPLEADKPSPPSSEYPVKRTSSWVTACSLLVLGSHWPSLSPSNNYHLLKSLCQKCIPILHTLYFHLNVAFWKANGIFTILQMEKLRLWFWISEEVKTELPALKEEPKP